MANTTAVVDQLRALHGLTRVEIAVTRARAGQARTPAVRQELLANAAAAAGRAERIAQVLDGLGAGPDPVTAAVGWASTAARTALEQVQPLDQALLGDLALQHQLAERGRYLLTCAGDAPPAVRELAAQLVDDHLETIDRLRDLLAELASGGDSELRPTPLQALAVGVVRVASLPARLTLAGLQRTVGADIKATISDPDGEVDTAAEAALTITGPGSDVHGDLAAAAETAPPVGSAADSEIATEAARWDDADVAPPTSAAGDDAELPIPGYDALPVRGIVIALRGINDDADLTAVEQYERSHKNRTGVLTAVQNRTEALAHDTARG